MLGNIAETMKNVVADKKFLIIIVVCSIFIGLAIYVYSYYVAPKLDPDFVPNREFVPEKEQAKQAAEQEVEQEQQRQYNERIAQEKEQAKLEANKKHTGMVRGEIKDHLISACGIDNALATKIVKALLHINRVTINY